MSGNLKRYRLYKAVELLCFSLPFLLLVAINFQSYIVIAEVRFSLYFYLALIILFVAFKDKAMEVAKKNSALSLSLVIFFTSLIMKNMADELMWLAVAGILGSILSAIISPVSCAYFFECYEVTPNGGKKRIHNQTMAHKEAWRNAYK